MSRETFDAGWLALREPVDHRSRSRALLAPLRAWWTAHRARRVADLGAGTGSNLRWLAPELPGPQEWTLVDHDAALLAGAELPPGDVRVTTLAADLAGPGLGPVAAADLVTASALLDLVSEGWIESLADACSEAGAAALLALTYDGTAVWSAPTADPVDALVLGAVNRHQRGDKGFGPALGPEAVAAADEAFRARGYAVRLEPSPWVLEAADAALVEPLVRGWAKAATELLPAEETRLSDWAERRTADVRTGKLRLTVGHVDLLALLPDGVRP